MSQIPRSKILGPMLYIHQPAMKIPNIKMQDRYRVKGSSNKNAETEQMNENADYKEIDTTEEEEKIEVQMVETNRSKEIRQEIIVETVSPIDNTSINDQQAFLNSDIEETMIEVKVVDEPKRRQGFNDLSMDEKLLFLTKVPVNVARIRYKFITADQIYIGYFLENKGDYIVITHRQSRLEIIIDALLDIQIYGL